MKKETREKKETNKIWQHFSINLITLQIQQLSKLQPCLSINLHKNRLIVHRREGGGRAHGFKEYQIVYSMI